MAKFTSKHLLKIVILTSLAAVTPTAFAAEQDKEETLQEIIVTATKIGVTKLQETPLAISTFTVDQLDQTLVARSHKHGSVLLLLF